MTTMSGTFLNSGACDAGSQGEGKESPSNADQLQTAGRDKYQPYPEYKDSGVEWLGIIPENWTVTCIKRLSSNAVKSFTDGDWIESPYITDAGVRLIQTGNIGIGKYKEQGYRYISNDTFIKLRCTEVKPNDVLICRLAEPVGRACLAPSLRGKMLTSVDVSILKLSKDIDERYVVYFLTSNEYLGHLNSAGRGGTRQRIARSDLGDTAFVLPSINEQRTIAAFLDYETARIDQLIAKQQQLIELLKEKRQAVISHAVKPRPNEKHVKISYVIDLLTGFPFPSSEFKQSGENIIRLLRGVNVGVDQVKWDDTVFWDSQDCDSLKGYHLQCGDIVFGMDRPWISNGARVAEISNDDMPCLLLQRVARIRANHLAYQSFIKLCLASNEFRAYVEADLTGVSVPHISPEQIKNFIIRDLSYEEQVSVTTDALNKLEQLRIIEQTALNAIELIQERRTALISAAVTGKIDLRGWRPPKREVAA